MKKAIFLTVCIILIMAIAVFTWQYQNQPVRMTFDECDEIGGTAWPVDVFHPEICPTCKSCYECGEDSKNFTNCPNCESCSTCMGENYPYSENCPNGMKYISGISDAAIWFQCCK